MVDFCLMTKSRHFYAHPKTNKAKLEALDRFQYAYTEYLQICVTEMLTRRRSHLVLAEKKAFFPESEKFTVHISRCAQDHAISIVYRWARFCYENKLKAYVQVLYQCGFIDIDMCKALFTVGKKSAQVPGGWVSQESLDLYWDFLLREDISGSIPTITNRCGIQMDAFSSVLHDDLNLPLSKYWISISHLVPKYRIHIPLMHDPKVKSAIQVSRGVHAYKTKRGRWCFQVIEKEQFQLPKLSKNAPKIGVDVGLNVLATTSNGDLYSVSVKEKFNNKYALIKAIRANRQQQCLYSNSIRLNILEANLTGFQKTEIGTAVNRLIADYPGHRFVIENLDLKGTKGQKRFAFRLFHNNLVDKAHTVVVTPAYTSQECPSCGYVSRKNRSGTKFQCKSCGRVSHADVIGAINLLRRSEDKQILVDDDPKVVKKLLTERYKVKRNSHTGNSSLEATRAFIVMPETYYQTSKSGTVSNQVTNPRLVS